MQVSWGEAGQQKALYVLDASWQCTERIPLDIGPRHFHFAGADTAAADAANRDALRQGDKVHRRR